MALQLKTVEPAPQILDGKMCAAKFHEKAHTFLLFAWVAEGQEKHGQILQDKSLAGPSTF